MTRNEVLEALRTMTNVERLEVIETATRLLRNAMETSASTPSEDLKEQLRRSAEVMREEYEAGGDLTAFTVLDAEDFHDEAR